MKIKNAIVAVILFAVSACGFVPGKGIVGPGELIREQTNQVTRKHAGRNVYDEPVLSAAPDQVEPSVGLRQGVHICATRAAASEIVLGMQVRGWESRGKDASGVYTFSDGGSTIVKVNSTTGDCVVTSPTVSMVKARKLANVWRQGYFPDGVEEIGTEQCPAFKGTSKGQEITLKVLDGAGSCTGDNVTVAVNKAD